MTSKKSKLILLYIWLFAFVASILILILNIGGINEDPAGEYTYVKLLNEIVGTYGPQLLTMLAFIFSPKYSKNKQVDKKVVFLAIVLSSIYCAIFLFFMIAFHSGAEAFSSVKKISSYMHDFRPVASTLVTASIAYLFANEEI